MGWSLMFDWVFSNHKSTLSDNVSLPCMSWWQYQYGYDISRSMIFFVGVLSKAFHCIGRPQTLSLNIYIYIRDEVWLGRYSNHEPTLTLSGDVSLPSCTNWWHSMAMTCQLWYFFVEGWSLASGLHLCRKDSSIIPKYIYMCGMKFDWVFQSWTHYHYGTWCFTAWLDLGKVARTCQEAFFIFLRTD